jgi:Putative peptidoglycan binding domain
MSERHTVEQGETMSSIAHDFGFMSFETILNHPQNAELKAARNNPHVLLPGDVVFIPDKTAKNAAIAAGEGHVFKVKRSPLTVRIALLDLQRKPLGNVDCKVFVDGSERSHTSDGEGVIEVSVRSSTREVKLVTPEQELILDVGALDPVEEVSGWQARLRNLGYFHGEVGDDSNVDESSLALRLFQADNDLDVTGEPDANTRAKLLDSHGS